MLIYADGRNVLEHARELSLRPVQDTMLRCAARTVPANASEFLAAAHVLVHVVSHGIVDDPESALEHARAILARVETGRIDASILRHLREIAPLCRVLDDDLPLLAISSMMEGLRPHALK